MTAPAESDPTGARFEYFRIGLHHYIAARYAAFARMDSVAGTLFHHSIEMLAKGYLVYRGKTEQQRRTLGHNLPRLWNAVKAEACDDASLGRFDTAIGSLEPFWSLRYPETMQREGMRLQIDLVPWQPPAGFSTAGSNQPPLYHLTVTDMDQLVKILCDLGSVNPRVVATPMSTEAESFLSRDPAALI
jgi:hypothetical protein